MVGKHSKEAQEKEELKNKLKEKEEQFKKFKLHIVDVLKEIDRLNISTEPATRRRISELALDERYKIMSQTTLKRDTYDLENQ